MAEAGFKGGPMDSDNGSGDTESLEYADAGMLGDGIYLMPVASVTARLEALLLRFDCAFMAGEFLTRFVAVADRGTGPGRFLGFGAACGF